MPHSPEWGWGSKSMGNCISLAAWGQITSLSLAIRPALLQGQGITQDFAMTYSFSGKQKSLPIVLAFQAGKWYIRKQSQWWKQSLKQESEPGTAQNLPLRALCTHDSPLSYSFDTELPNRAPADNPKYLLAPPLPHGVRTWSARTCWTRSAGSGRRWPSRSGAGC